MSLRNFSQPPHPSKIKRYASSKWLVAYVQRVVIVLLDHPDLVAFPFLQDRDALFVASSLGSTSSVSANLSTVTCRAFLTPSSNPTIVLRGTLLSFESSSTVSERWLLILLKLPSLFNNVCLLSTLRFRDRSPRVSVTRPILT